MGAPRPFTPDALADRWGVSSETVRQLIKRGDLPGFRVGRMFRIPAQAVEDFEQCQTSASDGSEAASASTGETTQQDDGSAIVLRQAPERKRKPRR